LVGVGSGKQRHRLFIREPIRSHPPRLLPELDGDAFGGIDGQAAVRLALAEDGLQCSEVAIVDGLG
jgi:hypothetical protein